MSATRTDRERPTGLGPLLAGICFSIVIAWALVSVLELTGTLTSAVQIKHRVRVINNNLTPIRGNLDFIRYAGMVAKETVTINAAAAPLTHQAATILATARSIDSKVGPILRNATARSIDSKVGPILRNATAINGVVHQINQNAIAINNNVLAIHATVASIGAHVSSIAGSVASINGSVNSIHSRVATVKAAVGPVGTSGSSITPDLTRVDNDFAGILSTVRLIQPGVHQINNNVDTIIGIVAGIKSDFDNILANVGLTNGSSTVVGHANSIDCSGLINLAGPTTDCNGNAK